MGSLKPAGADVVVIGAGVVGLATAALLAAQGRRVIVLERNGEVGLETSSRNSQVIHAGLYYPPGSLKATTCVRGRALLVERCVREGIPHRKLGKFVVATSPDERGALESLMERAIHNDAGAIEWLEADQLVACEPRIRAHAALASPESGIVDAHQLVRSYQAALEAHGGEVAVRTEVTGLVCCAHGWKVETCAPDGSVFTVDAGQVVNAAGLASDRMAELAGLDVDTLGWRLHPCKGQYFSVARSLRGMAGRLVYPVPAGPGLGIHLTLDLAGGMRLGPDANYVDLLDYHVDADQRQAFARAASHYLPELRPEHLQPEMAGIRPKLQGPGDGFRDFVVQESSAHGAPGMLHFVGIESPGLTAAGALAELAADLL